MEMSSASAERFGRQKAFLRLLITDYLTPAGEFQGVGEGFPSGLSQTITTLQRIPSYRWLIDPSKDGGPPTLVLVPSRVVSLKLAIAYPHIVITQIHEKTPALARSPTSPVGRPKVPLAIEANCAVGRRL